MTFFVGHPYKALFVTVSQIGVYRDALLKMQCHPGGDSYWVDPMYADIPINFECLKLFLL